MDTENRTYLEPALLVYSKFYGMLRPFSCSELSPATNVIPIESRSKPNRSRKYTEEHFRAQFSGVVVFRYHQGCDEVAREGYKGLTTGGESGGFGTVLGSGCAWIRVDTKRGVSAVVYESTENHSKNIEATYPTKFRS